MGINPLHFAGVQLLGTGGTPNLQNAIGCSQPWSQYSWQNTDAVSREQLAEAIAEAEAEIERYLGYRLLPSWEVDEWRPQPRPYRAELVTYNHRNLRGYSQGFDLRWGMFVAGGQRAETVIDAAAAVVYSDPDSDSYDELATATVATTVTNTEEIRAYLPGHAGQDGYEIRPITVAIAGGVATITWATHLGVVEANDEALVWDASDGADAANFIATVAVARVANDPQSMAQLVWEPTPGGCGCDIVGAGTCATCQYTVQVACLHARDAKLGLVAYSPAAWDADAEDFDTVTASVGRNPDYVRAWYRAGLRDMSRTWPTREMSPHWERAVAVLAASKLDRDVCSCASAAVTRWGEDLAFERGATELQSYKVTDALKNCPLGTKRGAWTAWQQITGPGGRIYRDAVLA